MSRIGPLSVPGGTPGILLTTGRFLDRSSDPAGTPAEYGETCSDDSSSARTYRLGDWLSACMTPAHVATERSVYAGPALTVLIDGYLSDVDCGTTKCQWRTKDRNDAEIVAERYQAFGIAFISQLRGSFTGLILDHTREQALLFNDRQGSRPVFVRGEQPHGLLAGPRVQDLIRARHDPVQLHVGAIGEFLVRGCFYGSDTLFEGVLKLPLATVVTIDRDAMKSSEYWRPRYGNPSDNSVPALLEAFDKHLARATRRLLGRLREPALLLSGGLDSRLMLAYANAAGTRLPCFTYHVEGSQGDDHTIAHRIASLTGNAFSSYPISIADFQRTAVQEALAADCRVQIIDAPSDRWEYIANRHASMFIGDESFGWKAQAHSADEAVDAVGWWNIDASPRISDWLQSHARRRIETHIAKHRETLVKACSETSPDDLKDHLYYRERMGNLLNGFSARRLAVAEQARPFLDEDLIDFLATVPAHLRCEKRLARMLMQSHFADLDALPYAARTSVPWDEADFVRSVRESPALHDFFLHHLDHGLDERLGEVFDRPTLGETARRLFAGEKLPRLRAEWWAAIPGAWRLSRQRQDRVGTLRGLLRVLQLNLNLTHLTVRP